MKLKIVYKRKLKRGYEILDNAILLKIDKNSYVTLSKACDNLEGVKRNYEEIISKAIECKLDKLNLDLFGLERGLSRDKCYLAATQALEGFLSNPSKIKITLNACTDSIMHEAKMLQCASLKGDECYQDEMDILPRMPYMPKSIEYSISLNRIFDLVDTSEMFIPLDEIKSPMAFIDSYMADNNIKKSYLYSNGFDKDDCSKCRCNKKCFTKVDCFRASIVLGLNRTQILQLLSYGGYAFNPNDELDIWFNDYLQDGNLEPDMAHFMDTYYEEENVLSRIFNGQ